MQGARKEGAGDDMGRAEDKERASQEEARKVGEGAAELAHQEIMVDKVAAEIDWLHREHEEQIKDLRPQAHRVPGLEAELAKATDAESVLHQEFEQRLAKVKEELLAKYESEVGELCTV
jgi:hypothetical protein